jgi:predicted nucleic acid-binding protein
LSLVLDASMAIAWLFEDERTPAADAVLVRVTASGANVPSLWRLEIASVLRNAVRRGRCDVGFVDRSIDRLRRLAITVDGETDNHAWGETTALARQHDLTPYDAAYLELALRLRQPLASCDEDLIAAAERCGVATMPA